MLPLHSPSSVFSPRHTPTWLLLASAGGAVNAIAFVSCSRFVSHITGAVSRLGMGASGATESLAVESGIVLGSLVLGAMSSSALARWPGRAGKPLPALPLFVVASLLAALGVLGARGIWGAVDGVVDGPRSVIFLSLLAFAMSLQNATVATCTGLMVRTTHMTGTVTDWGCTWRGQCARPGLRARSPCVTRRFGRVSSPASRPGRAPEGGSPESSRSAPCTSPPQQSRWPRSRASCASASPLYHPSPDTYRYSRRAPPRARNRAENLEPRCWHAPRYGDCEPDDPITKGTRP